MSDPGRSPSGAAASVPRVSKRAMERRRLLTVNPVLPGGTEPADTALERKEEVDHVRHVLERLSEREREILLMRHAGFSYKEIAEAVDVAPTSVGTLLARAERNFVNVYRPPGESDDPSR